MNTMRLPITEFSEYASEVPESSAFQEIHGVGLVVFVDRSSTKARLG